jgi:hypothetical protein
MAFKKAINSGEKKGDEEMEEGLPSSAREQREPRI